MEQKEHQYFGRGFTRMHTDTSDLNPKEPLLSSKGVSRHGHRPLWPQATLAAGHLVAKDAKRTWN